MAGTNSVELWRSGEFRFCLEYFGKPQDIFEILLRLCFQETKVKAARHVEAFFESPR